jgi:hypothetical protein
LPRSQLFFLTTTTSNNNFYSPTTTLLIHFYLHILQHEAPLVYYQTFYSYQTPLSSYIHCTLTLLSPFSDLSTPGSDFRTPPSASRIIKKMIPLFFFAALLLNLIALYRALSQSTGTVSTTTLITVGDGAIPEGSHPSPHPAPPFLTMDRARRPHHQANPPVMVQSPDPPQVKDIVANKDASIIVESSPAVSPPKFPTSASIRTVNAPQFKDTIIPTTSTSPAAATLGTAGIPGRAVQNPINEASGKDKSAPSNTESAKHPSWYPVLSNLPSFDFPCLFFCGGPDSTEHRPENKVSSSSNSSSVSVTYYTIVPKASVRPDILEEFTAKLERETDLDTLSAAHQQLDISMP